jgi:hypothetical protein
MTIAHPDFALSFIPSAAKATESPPFLSGPRAVADAAMLAREFGSDACAAAALRAAQSRARDNSRAFCHWREVERMVMWFDGDINGATRH